MRSLGKLASAAGAGAAATTLLALPAGAATPAHPGHAPAVFVQTDGLDGNAVVAYDRTADGGLAPAGTYPTGGLGGQLTGSVVDHLASEGSLAYDAASRTLFAVNAGSNSLTAFGVDGDHLTRRQVVPTGGDFPVSVAVRGPYVFVLNARDGGSVSGYLQLAGHLIPIPGWHRALGLATATPGDAHEFTSTPGQIGFTPDGRNLLVSSKNGGNSVLAFPFGFFGPAAQPVVTSLPGTVPFGFDFDGAGHLVLTEAGTNSVATFAVGRAGALTALDVAATGQAATCWVTSTGRISYASNAGSGTLAAYATGRNGTLTSLGTTATDPGTVDATVSPDGRFLYAQTGKGGIVDAYRIGAGGGLTATGTVTVPDSVGAEGIVAL